MVAIVFGTTFCWLAIIALHIRRKTIHNNDTVFLNAILSLFSMILMLEIMSFSAETDALFLCDIICLLLRVPRFFLMDLFALIGISDLS